MSVNLIDGKDAEIEQLKAEIERLQFLNQEEQVTIEQLAVLITELCDALQRWARSFDDEADSKLVKRAREAT